MSKLIAVDPQRNVVLWILGPSFMGSSSRSNKRLTISVASGLGHRSPTLPAGKNFWLEHCILLSSCISVGEQTDVLSSRS